MAAVFRLLFLVFRPLRFWSLDAGTFSSSHSLECDDENVPAFFHATRVRTRARVRVPLVPVCPIIVSGVLILVGVGCVCMHVFCMRAEMDFSVGRKLAEGTTGASLVLRVVQT